MDIFEVILTKRAKHNLKQIPSYIAQKFQLWLDLVETQGLNNARKIISFHVILKK